MTAPADTRASSATAVDAPPLLPLSMVRAAALGRSEPVRSTTPLGTIDAGAIADVDGAGGVQMRGAEWSLDWWVGAEDRWHHPSREAAVRQSTRGAAPVVETAMRVPGGDVVHRAFAVRATAPVAAARADGADGETWADSAVVVEVENSTFVPVALALVLRPVGIDGIEGGDAVRQVTSDGAVIRVGGQVVAVLSREPARVAHGAPGRVAALLEQGEDLPGGSLSVEAGTGGVEVAFVVPLPHTATVRILLPRVDPAPMRRRFRERARPEPGVGWEAPAADSIVSGWDVHTGDAARVELPEPLLGEVLTSSQRTLSLAFGDDFLGAGHGTGPGAVSDADRATAVVEALVRSGLTEPLGPLARALVGAQRLRGPVTLDDGSDASAALLLAAAPLLEAGAPGWAEELVGPVAKAVHRIGKLDAATTPLVAEALALVGPGLRRVGQPDVADEAERLSAELGGRGRSPGQANSGANGPASGTGIGGGLVGVGAEIRAGIRSVAVDAVGRLLELTRLGAPGSLPDRVDADGVPEGRLGFDPAAVAARLNAVLDLVVLDGADGPTLLPVWLPGWWGQPIEAHGVRTGWGRVSFGVRWHGDRPALLWEIQPVEGAEDGDRVPVLRAPGLDPAWQGSGWSGEALLGAVEVPATMVAIRGAAAAPAESAPAESAQPAPAPAPSTPSVAAEPPEEGTSFS